MIGFIVGMFFRIIGFLLLLQIVLFIHEYGHLQEMQARNVPIQEFSLGGGWPYYQYQGKEFTWSFRVIPFIAYVAPTDEGGKVISKELSSWSQFAIYSAGVRNNIAVALAFLVFFQILGWKRGNLSGKELIITLLHFPFKIILRFLALLVDLVTFGRMHLGQRFLLSTGGVIPQAQLKIFLLLSLFVGFLNLVPMPPLDGSRILESLVAILGGELDFQTLPEFAIRTSLMVVFILVAFVDTTLLEVDREKS